VCRAINQTFTGLNASDSWPTVDVLLDEMDCHGISRILSPPKSGRMKWSAPQGVGDIVYCMDPKDWTMIFLLSPYNQILSSSRGCVFCISPDRQ